MMEYNRPLADDALAQIGRKIFPDPSFSQGNVLIIILGKKSVGRHDLHNDRIWIR